MTLWLMLGLGGSGDGAGSRGAIGIADTGKGRSTAMMMETTKSEIVEGSLEELGSAGDINAE